MRIKYFLIIIIIILCGINSFSAQGTRNQTDPPDTTRLELDPETQPPQTQMTQNRTQNSTSPAQNVNNSRIPDSLPPRSTIGLPFENYYMESSGRYVFFGKPLIQKKFNLQYKIDNQTYNEVSFSVRYYHTPRITGDDIFDDLTLPSAGFAYKGEISHDYRFLNLGNPYASPLRRPDYLPRTFIRLDIKTPEGTKYIICPSLDSELLYQISDEEMQNRAKLLIESYNRFRRDIFDLMLYERMRYSIFVWITLKKSRYEKIDISNIIWHYYSKELVTEMHFYGNLEEIKTFFKEKNLPFNDVKLTEYYKENNYLINIQNELYYILKFVINDLTQYVIVPSSKIYHNSLNQPVQELVTYFARIFIGNAGISKIIAGKEKALGVWEFISFN